MLLAHPMRMQTHSQQYESSYDLPPQNQDPAASVYIVPKTAEGVEMEALSPPSAAEPSGSVLTTPSPQETRLPPAQDPGLPPAQDSRVTTQSTTMTAAMVHLLVALDLIVRTRERGTRAAMLTTLDLPRAEKQWEQTTEE
jgi:hypothetical protein